MSRIVVASVLAALVALPGRSAAENAPPSQQPSSQSSSKPQNSTPPQQPPASGSTPAGAGASSQSGQAPGEGGTAQDEAARKKLEEDIARELGAQPGAAAQPGASGGAEAAGPTGAPAPSGQPAVPGASGTNPYARLLLLPDLSAIGSFAAAYDSYDVAGRSPRTGPYAPADKVQARFEELELGLQAVVDPYARADVFVSFTPDEVAVEEAYLTTLRLPFGLQARAGRFFSPFGRLNGQHPHVWDFVDAPLAEGRLVADENLAGPGLDLTWLAPLPWYTELHVAAQSIAPAEGDEERLTGVARLVQFFPVGDATTIGLGLSGAVRDEPGGAKRDLGGVDAYLRFRPPGGRSYLALQAEGFARRLRGGTDDGTDTGWYAQAFWREGAYAGFGARYDEAPAAGDAAPGTERRVSALGTWFLTEFQRLRLQVAYDRLPGGRDGVEALLHLEFGIGAHGAHPF